ncbi:DUF6577 family protein [Proteiniclasticum sp.]|uniref:DUF6577 family protein n=1 Tax=Proteiniclasticum sp. TaxID=2053595 RepID=UPI0028A28E97|nr:DUF6577 family protein [Proteiniclasticum sp.]
MKKENMTADEKFLRKLSNHMNNSDELSLKMIYSLFPEMNRNTISWRLYSLVQQGKIYRTGHGIYSRSRNNENNVSAGYEYLQRKSKEIYDILTGYGYDFYITGLDSLVGEILHMPENYPVLIIIEESGIKEIQEVLNEKAMFVITEKDREIFEKTILRNKVDVILLRGKDLSLATDNISQKEKGFIDLYYAVTRLEYGISIPELSRIYQNLQRNNSIAKAKMKAAAKDRGISIEINWLLEMNKASEKTIEFMSYLLRR